MNERWKWVVRYLVVIALAVILALVLGEMSLFKATRIGKTGLNAARIVQFLGFGGALLVLWLAAQRAAAVLPAHDRRWGVVKSVLLPLTTLIVVAAGQAVALLLLGPVMSKTWHEVYNWIAIAAITLSAAWLLIALFTGSSTLAPLLGNGRSRA
jgi:hypothetical protein